MSVIINVSILKLFHLYNLIKLNLTIAFNAKANKTCNYANPNSTLSLKDREIDLTSQLYFLMILHLVNPFL